jgi:hypothetical protein
MDRLRRIRWLSCSGRHPGWSKVGADLPMLRWLARHDLRERALAILRQLYALSG